MAPYPSSVGSQLAPYPQVGSQLAPYPRVGSPMAPYPSWVGSQLAPYPQVGSPMAPYPSWVGSRLAPDAHFFAPARRKSVHPPRCKCAALGLHIYAGVDAHFFAAQATKAIKEPIVSLPHSPKGTPQPRTDCPGRVYGSYANPRSL